VKSLLVTIVLLAGGIVGYFYWQHTKYPVSIDEPKVELIKKSTIEDKITGSGKLELKGGLYYVLAEAPGKIVKLGDGIVVGNAIKKDAILFRLDDTQAQAELSSAEASVTTADADIERARAMQITAQAKIESVNEELNFARTKLVTGKQREKEGVAASGLVKEAEAELKKVEAAAKGADAYLSEANASYKTALANKKRAETMVLVKKRLLEQMNITAPTDGVILNVSNYLKDGQLIAPQVGALVTIAKNPNQWEVKAQISEQDIGKLQQKLNQDKNAQVRFAVEAYSVEKIKFTGKVIDIAALPSSPARPNLGGLEALQAAALGGGSSSGPANYTVTIEVDPIAENISKTHPLKVGFVASDLQIILENFNDIVTIPSPALSFTPEGMNESQQKELRKNEEEGWSAVWFWSDGKYYPKYIKAGASEEGRTHIKEVLGGKPDDLLGKAVVTDAPKKPEKGGLFGGGPIKMPG
jgi:multidrug resistance efflux pump